MDAPFVQASYASAGSGATNVQTENFDSLLRPSTDGNCPKNIAVGTVFPTSACLLNANDPIFGGATTSSSDPVDIGAHSTYAAVYPDAPLTITFPSAKKYVGFWWSAGSLGNNVSFLDESGTVVAELNANDIYNAVRTSYLSSYYLGHPGDLNTNRIRYDPTEPFVYIHAFSPTGFHAIKLSVPPFCDGFEFDNLTTADTAPSVAPRLVLVRDIYASQVLPTPSPNPGYVFGGWYSDSGFENYIGKPGDTYYPDSASSTLYPSWPCLFHPTYTDIAPTTGPIGTWVNLKGNQISHSQGDCGWQTIYFKAFDGAGNLISGPDWNVLPPEYIRDHSGNESVDVRIQSDLPAGTQTVKYHVDACPNWAHPDWGGCVPLDNAAQFTITVPTTYTFTYSAGSHGTITGVSPQTVNAGSSGTAVTAVADSGYHFVNWSDSSTANPRTDINASGDISVSANFSPDAPTTYTFTYSAGSHGTITGVSPQTVSAGASGTAVTPVANSGYHFVNWSDSSTANPRTDINASGNISVSANFSPDAGGGGDRGGGGGGGGGGEYSPPSPPETIIIIPATPSQPVIVQQPKKSGVKPAREVKVSKVESTTLIQIAPKPLITLGSSDIAIQGLNKGQYIRVTVTGVNGASQVITPSDNSELNTIINNNPKSKLKIEITPTLSSALKTGA